MPNEVSPKTRRSFALLMAATALVGVGVFIGILISPEPPAELHKRIAQLEAKLRAARSKISDLNTAVNYQPTQSVVRKGALKRVDRARHIKFGKHYAQSMRAVNHEQAAELIEWFVPRWNQLLDNPEDDDRVGRRAQLLSQLVGGMARTIDPDDFPAWQAEFLSGSWLGELHIDLDGDGFPGSKGMLSPKDSFVDRPLCEVVMALNQTMRDARIIVQQQLRCDSPRERISLFLQGKTLDDALTDFVRSLKRDGYWVREKRKRGIRIVAVGPKR